jgi:protein TonB
MDLQKLLTADYLDIVFDNRNKTYGSYELRRHYAGRMTRAILYLFAAASTLALLSFISGRKTTGPDRVFDKATIFTNIEIPKLPPPPKPATPPPPPHHLMTKPFTDMVITNDPIPDDKHLTRISDLNHAVIGAAAADGDSSDNGLTPDTHSSGGHGVIPAPPVAEKPRHFVEQMPLFTGDLGAYIATHLHYPDQARAGNIQGRVLIEFVINENGSVSDARVVSGIGGGCDEEALAMIRNMPNWKPGKQNGTPVKVYFTIPIKFELN